MTAETLYNAYTSECTKSYKTQCGSPIVSGHPLIHYKSNLMQSQTSDLLWITTLWKNHFVCRVKWTLKPWTNNEWSYIYSLRMNKNTENWSYSRLLLLKLRRKIMIESWKKEEDKKIRNPSISSFHYEKTQPLKKKNYAKHTQWILKRNTPYNLLCTTTVDLKKNQLPVFWFFWISGR